MPVPISSAFHFISISNVFCILLNGCEIAGAYQLGDSKKQEIIISWILNDENLQLVSHAAMLGCRYMYPMVLTSD